MQLVKRVRSLNGTVIIVILLVVLLGFVAISSLNWRITHDEPLMMYSAFLMDRYHAVPYLNLFDMNAPGSLLAYFFIEKLVGSQDLALRFVDLTILVAICWMIVKTQSIFDRPVAVSSAALFGLFYLSQGPNMSLQREYLTLLPLAGALLTATSNSSVRFKIMGLGVLFGILFVMRPPMVVGILPLALYVLIEHRPPILRVRWLISLVMWGCLGAAIPIGAVALYLWLNGAWAGFVDMVVRYWPLYTALGNLVETVSSIDRLGYNAYLLFNPPSYNLAYYWLILPILVGSIGSLFVSRSNPMQRKRIWLLLSLWAIYFLYPWLSGKFWPYHFLPSAFIGALLSGLCLVKWPGRLFSGLALLVSLFFIMALSYNIILLLYGRPLPPPKNGMPDEIAAYLQAHVQPGDRVQALDITSGVVHGMLLAGVDSATPFIYDFHFYHHLDNPYILKLRETFIADLKAAKPRYIIKSIDPSSYPLGIGVNRNFDALSAVLETDYRVALLRDERFIIYERK